MLVAIRPTGGTKVVEKVKAGKDVRSMVEVAVEVAKVGMEERLYAVAGKTVVV